MPRSSTATIPADLPRREMPHAGTAPAPFHDLLVHYDDGPAGANALAYAEALARDENVTALMFGYMAEYPVSIYSEVPINIWLSLQQKAEADAAELEARLRAALEKSGSRADLRRADVMSGDEGNHLALQGRYAEASIIGWSANGGTDRQKRLFEGALFHSGRPVILVPETFTKREVPASIMVAWSGEREAARAVHDALPLLKGAGRVCVLVVDNGPDRAESNPGDDIARHLARLGIEVEVKYVPSGGELIYKVILDEARYLGADMLVMGGYGHSRTGEWLFGGVTRDMLGAARIPLLMSH